MRRWFHWLRTRAWRDWISPFPLITLTCAGLFGWYILFGEQGVVMWRQLRHNATLLRQKEVILINRLRAIEEEKTRLQDPAYLEPIIRRELGYIRPNEQIFQFPETATPATTP